jgi:hypothetical protein
MCVCVVASVPVRVRVWMWVWACTRFMVVSTRVTGMASDAFAKASPLLHLRLTDDIPEKSQLIRDVC